MTSGDKNAPAGVVFAAASEFEPQVQFVPTHGKPRPVHVLKRGNEKDPAAEVGPGTCGYLPALESRFQVDPGADEGARRAALARWLVDKRNPLTWRSIVNRVWQYHFGRGIVDSPNDFGRMGALPTHPELLDWLAAEFRDGPQSIKQLHRLICTSAVYRQSSAGNAEFEKRDGANQFLWRMNRRRLEAEACATRCSPSPATRQHARRAGFPGVRIQGRSFAALQLRRVRSDDPQSHRRSVYRLIVRSVPDPFMATLDCADPSASVAKRNETLTPLQSLALLNNKFMVRMAEHFATRIEPLGRQHDERLTAGWRLAFGREPDEDEIRAAGRLCRSPRTGERVPPDLQHERVCVCRLMRMMHTMMPTANKHRRICTRRAAIFSGTSAADWAALRWPACWAKKGCWPAKSRPLESRAAASPAEGQARRAALHVRRRQPVRLVGLQAGARKAPRREVRSGRGGRAVSIGAGQGDEVAVRLAAARPVRQMAQRSGRRARRCVDDIAFIHSMVSKSNVHGPATFMQATGFVLPGFPSMGSWISYGLGSMNDDLPTFVVLPDPRGFAPNGHMNWSSGFLPAEHQATMVRPSAKTPIADLFPPDGLVRHARERCRRAGRARRAQPRARGDAAGRLAARCPHPLLRAGRADAAQRAGGARYSERARAHSADVRARQGKHDHAAERRRSTRGRRSNTSAAIAWSPGGCWSAACGSCRSGAGPTTASRAAIGIRTKTSSATTARWPPDWASAPRR